MPKVELALTSGSMAAFVIKRIIDFDDDVWERLTRAQRQTLIDKEGEAFLKENVGWDYKVR